MTELNLHKEFMAVLARKYNLKNPNSNDSSEIGHNLPLNEKIGHMLPETVGSTNSLFEQSLPISGAAEAESLADCQEQQVQMQVNVAQIHSDDQAQSLDMYAQSLDMGTGGANNILTSSQDGTIITSVQNSFVPDNSVQDSSVPGNSVRASSVLDNSVQEQSVTNSSRAVQLGNQIQDISGVDIAASEAAICKQFGLDPTKLRGELEDLFTNISQIINILAPNFQNTEPSLENLLKLIC